MIMANLIKKVASATSQGRTSATVNYEFAASSVSDSTSFDKSSRHRSSFLDFIQPQPQPQADHIRKTEEYMVHREFVNDLELQPQKRNTKFTSYGSERWRHYDLADIDEMSWIEGDDAFMGFPRRSTQATVAGSTEEIIQNRDELDVTMPTPVHKKF